MQGRGIARPGANRAEMQIDRRSSSLLIAVVVVLAIAVPALAATGGGSPPSDAPSTPPAKGDANGGTPTKPAPDVQPSGGVAGPAVDDRARSAQDPPEEPPQVEPPTETETTPTETTPRRRLRRTTRPRRTPSRRPTRSPARPRLLAAAAVAAGFRAPASRSAAWWPLDSACCSRAWRCGAGRAAARPRRLRRSRPRPASRRLRDRAGHQLLGRRDVDPEHLHAPLQRAVGGTVDLARVVAVAAEVARVVGVGRAEHVGGARRQVQDDALDRRAVTRVLRRSRPCRKRTPNATWRCSSRSTSPNPSQKPG